MKYGSGNRDYENNLEDAMTLLDGYRWKIEGGIIKGPNTVYRCQISDNSLIRGSGESVNICEAIIAAHIDAIAFSVKIK